MGTIKKRGGDKYGKSFKGDCRQFYFAQSAFGAFCPSGVVVVYGLCRPQFAAVCFHEPVPDDVGLE